MTKLNNSKQQHPDYKTKFGSMIVGTAETILSSKKAAKYKGKVQLVFTSPPFPLNRKKKYGNLQGAPYITWLEQMSLLLRDFLTEDGSLSWRWATPGKRVRP